MAVACDDLGTVEIVRRPHLGVRRRVRVAWLAVTDLRHWRSLHRLDAGKPDDYRAYLDIQLRRTLVKRSNDPGVGMRLLVDHVASLVPGRAGRVLCIGCRNPLELDEFRARGFTDVVGVDLYSQRSDILVMDMHELAFADDSFDVVYSSHSLEHSFAVERVVSEIARVARDGAVIAVEVPVRGRASEADRIEFAGVDDLRAAFRAHVGEEIEAEEQPARSETNAQGGDVARLVFRLEKAPSTASRPVAVPSKSRRRVLAGAGAAIAIVLFLLFGLLPEVLGDWPYNAYGKDSRRHTTVHHHAPRSLTARVADTDVS